MVAFTLTLPELAGGWELTKTSREKTEKMSDLSCSVSGEENLLAILKRRWWKYMILGVIDIEANYLVIKAYQYTTLTSVQVSVHFSTGPLTKMGDLKTGWNKSQHNFIQISLKFINATKHKTGVQRIL